MNSLLGERKLEMIEKSVCKSCGAIAAEGKTGCRKLFEAILVKDYSDFRYAKTHRLMVDAYSLQHLEEFMLSGKSFAAHLTGMYAAFECEDSASVNRAVQKWLSSNPQIDKPAKLPEKRGDITITYIHDAKDAEEHEKRVPEWAKSAWAAWSEFHELAKLLINEATAKTK